MAAVTNYKDMEQLKLAMGIRVVCSSTNGFFVKPEVRLTRYEAAHIITKLTDDVVLTRNVVMGKALVKAGFVYTDHTHVSPFH